MKLPSLSQALWMVALWNKGAGQADLLIMPINSLTLTLKPPTCHALLLDLHKALLKQALQLLGKIGGRSRKAKEPPTLGYKDNPEHGLRLILTFQPTPPFLLPLERVLQMCDKAFKRRTEG